MSNIRIPDGDVVPAPPAPETNGLAVGAFVISLFGASLPALIMGIIALKQCRRDHRRGDGFALAAIWIGGLGTVFWSIFMIALIIGVAASGGGS